MLRTAPTILASLALALVAPAAMAQPQPEPPPIAPAAATLPAPPPPRVETRRQSYAAMATGTVLIPLGGLAVISGAAIAFLPRYGNCVGCKPSDPRPLGFALMGAGAGVVGGGIALVVYGSHRVPVAGEAAARGTMLRSADVRVGPGSGSLTFHF
jgi:hypothetical protein